MRGWKPDHHLQCRPSRENAQPGLEIPRSEFPLKYHIKNWAQTRGSKIDMVCKGQHPSPLLPPGPSTSRSSPPSEIFGLY